MVIGKRRIDPFQLRIILAFAAIYIIWGSTYLAIRFAVETIPPFIMAGMRFVIAGAVMYAWARLSGVKGPLLVEWRSAAIIGIALLLFSNGGVTWSEQRVASGIAALIVATVPLWIVLMQWLLHNGSPPSRRMAAGLMIGFCGVLWLIGPDQLLGHRTIDLTGVAVLLIACFSWSNGSLYARKAKLPSSQILATAMEMISGGVALLLAGLITGEFYRFDPLAVSMKSFLSLAYLVVFGSIIGFTAYVWLLRHAAPTRVATYAYVNPVIAIALGAIFAGEQINSQILVSAATIIFAIVLIITSQTGETKVNNPQTNIRNPQLAQEV
jgi:drug/metabolite transporter (DMT)-like permease